MATLEWYVLWTDGSALYWARTEDSEVNEIVALLHGAGLTCLEMSGHKVGIAGGTRRSVRECREIAAARVT